MKSLTKRVLTSVIALPILFASAFLFEQYHHPLLMLIFMAAISFGTYEMSEIVKKSGRISPIVYLAPLLPLVAYIEKYLIGEDIFVFFLFVILSALAFSIEVFKGADDDFKTSIDTLGRSLLILTYPALLSIFLVNILFLENSSYHIALYFFFVFGEDTFAYFSGMLFGRNNRGIVKVSPKKSIAGYIGGSLIPALIGSLSPVFFPAYYAFTPLVGFFLGLFTSFFAEIGDLVESLFKRSAGIKDSGTIIPGRGGILDSIDSLMIAAPAFMILSRIFGLV